MPGTIDPVFWSGIRGGDDAARHWTAEHGGITLEETVERLKVWLPRWNPSDPASVCAWRAASAEFATGAEGHVTVLQGEAVRVNSIWAQVEYPALRANPNITSITAVNPQTDSKVVLWSK